MDSLEKQAVRELNTRLISDLDPKYIGPYLYEKKYLSKEQLLELLNGDRIPRETCQILLLDIVDNCPFQIFLKALRYEKAYPHLADSLEKKLESLKEEYGTQRQENETLFVSVGKIRVDNGYRKQLAKLAHGLKKLSHDGNVDVFSRLTENIHKRCRMHNFRDTVKATDKMKQADIRFIVLDAEIEARRLKYDVTLYQSDVFQSMKDLIPYTTNPTVSSMTFLARYGSSLTMRESIDTGLKQLDIAKQHATQVQPCKETGMVFYIEINLLFQQYEQNPESNLKENILKRTDLAISHFNEDEFGTDYQRMLLLKKAFCHLGIGLFGERIPHAIVDNQDVTSAGNCLDFVEKKVWDGIEARRKMFFMIARSEWYRRQNNYEFAKMYAKRAKKLAKKNEWKKEAENIIHLLDEIDTTYAKHIYVFDDVECIQKYVDDILAPNDDDYFEKDNFLHMNDKAQCIVGRVHKGDNFSNVTNESFGVLESAVNNHFESQTLTTPGISERLVSVGNNDTDILIDDDNDDDDEDDDDKLYFTDEKDHKVVDKARVKTAVKHQCIRNKVHKDQRFSDMKNRSFGIVESSVDNRFDYQTLYTSGKSKRSVSVINVDPGRIDDDDDDDDDDQLNLIDENEGTVVRKEIFINVGTSQCLTDRVYNGDSFSDEKNGSFGVMASSADNELDHETLTSPGINEGLIPVSNVNNNRLDDGDGDNTLYMTEEPHDTLRNVVKVQCLKDRVHNGDSFLDPNNGIYGAMESSVNSLLDPQTLTTSGNGERPVSIRNIDAHILDYDDDDDQLDLTDTNEDIMVHKEPFVNVVKSQCFTYSVHKCDSLSDVQKGSFGVVESSADNHSEPQTLTSPGSIEGLISIVKNVKPDRLDGDDGKLDLREENKDTVVDIATVKNVVDLRKRKSVMNMKLNIQQNSVSDTTNKLTLSKGELVRPDGYEPKQSKIRRTECI